MISHVLSAGMRHSVALLQKSTLASRGAFLVTGGGSGLGEAVARRLRSDGFNVVICDMKDSSSLASGERASPAPFCTANASRQRLAPPLLTATLLKVRH